MTADVSALTGFAVAGTACVIATPVAIAVARHTGFYDRPREYRRHAAPTPFLGGAAVVFGFLVATGAVGAFSGRILVLLGCTGVMWLVGTYDDRFAIPPKWRLLTEALAAAVLAVAGLGWKTTGGSGFDFVLTVVWIVSLVNSFNLMDNMDGACSAVGGVSALGIGALAAVHDQAALAGMAFGLAGACLVFLRWNLARPARIFLGDGGSMVVGFLLAALGMATGGHLQVGDANLLAIALMVGIAMLDTTLVSVSRLRRGVPIVTGGRDHLTHRLLRALSFPRRVALALAAAQATLCGISILGERLGIPELGLFAVAGVSIGLGTVIVLDSPSWRPEGIAFGSEAWRQRTVSASVGVDSG